ncbi:MAG: hypothetical protein ACRCVT_15815 [Leadbetterella sp.]
MKHYIILVSIFIYSYSFGQMNENECDKNIDTLYNRIQMLDSISAKLNFVNHFYFKDSVLKFNVYSEKKYHFQICDLVDTLNSGFFYSTGNCIQFKDKHVYHILAFRTFQKVSIILILNGGERHFFIGLNCCNKINTIAEVIEFLMKNLDYKKDDEIIKRVLNYNHYCPTYSIDDRGLFPSCECKN